MGTPRGVGCRGAVLGASGGVRVSGVYCRLTGTLGTQGQEGYRRHQGHWGLLGDAGVVGAAWGCQQASGM